MSGYGLNQASRPRTPSPNGGAEVAESKALAAEFGRVPSSGREFEKGCGSLAKVVLSVGRLVVSCSLARLE